MTEVGAVSIALELDRSRFNKDLRELESLKLEPLNLDIKLNGSNLQRQIRDLTKDLDCIPLDLCLHINERRLKAEVEKVKEYLTQELQLTVRAAVNANVKIESGAKDKNQTSTNSSVAEAAQAKLEASFQKVGDKLNAAIEKSLNSAFSAALSPFKGVARGFFEGIGQTFSKQLAKGTIESFQRELGINFKNSGTRIGSQAARTTNEILGRRGKEDDSSAGSGGRRTPKKPRPGINQEDSPLEKELKNIEDTLRSVNKAFSQAGGSVGSFGKSTTKAAEDALKLAGALVQLYGVITTTKNTSKGSSDKDDKTVGTPQTPVHGRQGAEETSAQRTLPDKTKVPNERQSVPSAHKRDEAQNRKVVAVGSPDSFVHRPIRGFLKGDRAGLTKEDAKNQVEAVRSQLDRQLSSLQALPQTEQTRKRIAALSKAIATIEARIASDIASSDIPKAVRQSLGQLKGASSKLAQTKRAIEAEAQKVARPIPGSAKGVIAQAAEASRKITANPGIQLEATLASKRRLPGVVKGAAKGAAGAAAGAGILSAGGAFAATPGAALSSLSGFAAGSLQDAIFTAALGGLGLIGVASYGALASAITPKIIRALGGKKLADTLETPVVELVQGMAKGLPGVFKKAIDSTREAKLPKIKTAVEDIARLASSGVTGAISVLGKQFSLPSALSSGAPVRNLLPFLRGESLRKFFKPSGRRNSYAGQGLTGTVSQPAPREAVQFTPGNLIERKGDLFDSYSPIESQPKGLESIINSIRRLPGVARDKTSWRLPPGLFAGKFFKPRSRSTVPSLQVESTPGNLIDFDLNSKVASNNRFNPTNKIAAEDKAGVEPRPGFLPKLLSGLGQFNTFIETLVAPKILQGLGQFNAFIETKIAPKLLEGFDKFGPKLSSRLQGFNNAVETKLTPKLEAGIRSLNSWIETKIAPKLLSGFENVGPKLQERMTRFNNAIETKLAPKLESGIRSLNSWIENKIAPKLLTGFDKLGPKLSSSLAGFNKNIENKLTPFLTEGIGNLNKQIDKAVAFRFPEGFMRRGAVKQVSNFFKKSLQPQEKPKPQPQPTPTPQPQPSPQPVPSPKTGPQPKPQPGVTPPEPGNYWERFFRGLEARFYRSPLFSGNVSPKDRRSLTSEAAGFFFSGAALVAPGTTLAALLVPLATALTPLITTVGLVTQALAPLVGTIATTLKQIEPLQARLLYVSGTESGARENRNFVQGVAEQFNISSFASLEQFSKLSAAVKGTRLQGEPLRDLFKGIATASKALALDTQDLNLVMFAFTQIASKGKLSAEEVRLQLAERFPGIINLLAKALGLTTIEFNRMLESGQLLAADVLPKLGKALQQEYGAAAVAASGNFLSAITKVENAIFRLKEGVARSLAPIFTSVASTIGSSLNLIAQNAEKLVPIFSVALIGFAAQFFVGLTQILEASGIIGKVQKFLIPLFSRLFVTLTPFMIGIVADFLDDILGAQTSVMDNMMRGVYNVVLGTILVVADLAKAIQNVTSSIGKNDTSAASKPNVFGQIFDSLKKITKIIPSTVVEFVSLSLILAQTYVLASQGLNLVLARFGTTVTALGASFVASARSGRLFNTALNTLTAGLTGSQLAATAATAAFLLFFAKADFTNELGSEFDKLADSMSGSLERISKTLDKTGDDLNKFPEKISKLKSQGFDLTMGLSEVFGLGGAFRTDDLINFANGETEKYFRAERDKGLITEWEYQQYTARPLRTLADKQFDDNKFKLDGLATSYLKILDKSGLLNGQFKNGNAGKALDEVRAIDKQIGDLQKARVVLLGDNVVISDSTKKEIAALDTQIQALLDRRGEVKKPIEEVRTEVLASADTLKSVLDAINNAAIPEDKKQELRNIIQPVLDVATQAKTKLQELGAIDLSPLGKQFADVVKEAEALNKNLDKNKNRLTVGSLKEQTSIQLQLANGDIDRNNADRQALEQEIANLRNNAQDLDSFIQERRKQLFELLAVPQPTPEQQDTITKYQSELTAKEVEFQQTQLSIAQKLVEARAKEIEKRLRQLDAAIKASEAALDGTNTEKVLRIKLSQTSAPATEVGEALFDRLYGEQRVDEIDGRIGITRKKIAGLDRNNFESEEKFIEAKAALQVELGNLIKQKIDERLNLERKLQEEVLRNIRVRSEAEIASLDRSKQLLESRRNLEKALSDAALAPGESQIQALDLALDIRRKLDEATDSKSKSKLNELLARLGASGDELSILQAKQRLEDDIAQKKLQALEQEQRYELELLGIDHKRQRLAQEQAVAEADIANQRALIATLNANKDLQEAKKSGDQDTIILAEKLLYINRQILDATAKQLDNANKNLEAQDEAASSAIAALDAQQQAARNSAQAAETLRNVQQDLAILEVSNKGNKAGDSSSPSTSNTKESLQSKPYQFKSMLEASRFHLFGILPGESNLGASLRQQFGVGDKKLTEEQQGLLELSSGSLLLPGKGKNTSVIQRLGQTNSSSNKEESKSGETDALSRPPGTGGHSDASLKQHGRHSLGESAESYFNSALGLQPGESTENYLLRSLGLQPGESVESYLNKPRSSYLGAPLKGNLEDLSLKYKPRYTSLEDLQQKHKPVAESFEELNQKYPNNTPGFTSFTDGLREANKNIEAKLDQLNQTMAAAVAAPRQLYVSSPTPVSDAAQIYSDIARGMTTAAGLG